MARRGDGLYLRSNTWYLDCRINGIRHVIKLGKGIKRTVAAELANVKRAGILKGDAGIGRKKKDLSFKDARVKFEAWMLAEKRSSTIRGYKECLVRLEADFGSKRLSEISPWALEKYRKERTEAGAPIRVNRELAVLKTLFSKVTAWGLYESENPVRAIRFRKEPRTRLRILESDEETRLLAVAPEPLRTIILLGLNTGLRRSEMLTLQWDDVDLHRGSLTVQAAYAKNGRTRTVPLNTVVREALVRLRSTSKDGLVFPGRQGKQRQAIQTPFQHACERARITGVTLHTLRHSFASRLVLSGVDLRTVQELGGWQTIAMVERYSHLTPAHKAQAVEKLAGFHNAFHNTELTELQAVR